MKFQFIYISILVSVLISGCSSEEVLPEDLNSRSAEIGIAAVYNIANSLAASHGITIRPSAPLGIFVSSFLAQGTFVQVASAQRGIEAQIKLLEGQNVPASSETFTLLTELATIMQVNIPDMLNRSTDRAKALNEYIASLKATGEVAQRKKQELEVRETQLKEERRTQRDAVSKIEREINIAFREKDYSTAASKQEALGEAESVLAETEVKLDQTSDIIRRYKDILEIASDMLQGIVQNREILIAGLRVVDVPGIDNLEILDENKQYKRSSNNSDDIFGTEFIE